MNKKIINSFQKMIDVNTPIIYICEYDYARVDALLMDVIGNKSIVEWNPGTGITDFRSKHTKGDDDTPLSVFLKNHYTQETVAPVPIEKYIVLKDIHDYLNTNSSLPDSTQVKSLLALMSQRKLYDRQYEKTIIIVAPVVIIPVELEKYVSFLEIDLPTEEEINELINSHIQVNRYNPIKFTDKDRQQLMPSLKGMSAFEIDRMLDMAMSSNGTLSARDRDMILLQKKQMVKKSGVLELVDAPENIDSIGGVDNLKNYLKKKSIVYSKLPEANRFGVTTPKGVFLVGMPGCGKSLCAKATAALFGAPLLKMDMGSMMGKYVGESEANLRKAIRIAEAAAPCILWIDEIEKAFSGIGGHNDIMTRMFGYFLSWMQEKKSAVYVFATANNADNLPPELKRKGRFDEIFCVNLPNDEERQDIFKVHIEKKSKCECLIDNLDYKSLGKQTKGFNGADIESVVNEAVEESFLSMENSRMLTTKSLLEVIKKTKSIYKSCRKQIEDMEVLFDENDFTSASDNPLWILDKVERDKRKAQRNK